jgi:predicted nucleic acid-binding protein
VGSDSPAHWHAENLRIEIQIDPEAKDGHRSRVSDALRAALAGGDSIVTTGFILQELLQRFAGPRARKEIVERFAALPLLIPDRRDYVGAAELRNRCRRSGIQVGTIDALSAQLCIRHGLTLLTTDADFAMIARHSALQV